MTNSRIFSQDLYRQYEEKIVHLLNGQPQFLSDRTAASTRAAGDAIQDILSENFRQILGDLCTEYIPQFPRRSMADFAFRDDHGNYYAVDVKTHREETDFNMPNLTSVKRLADFYTDDTNYFVILMVQYRITGNRVAVTKAHFVPIEYLSWDCLTLGALGWGQIQIANAQVIKIDPTIKRRDWVANLCSRMLTFYDREMEKLHQRREFFNDYLVDV